MLPIQKTTALLLIAVSLATGCASGDEVDDVEDVADDAAAIDDAWGRDPCKGAVATVGDPDGDHVFLGTDGPDVIVGTPGRDVIWGNGGDDVICGDAGEDEIHGGAGDDYIDGGFSNDDISAGDGRDVIHGRAGSDTIHGGDGDDLVFGDILDDHLFGDGGDDILIGGHGVDDMHGGEGKDWLRGDTNADEFDGGNGFDVASFVTATPPGQPQGSADEPNPVDGVDVDIAGGKASGDGFEEPLSSIEKVIGSPFNDRFKNLGSTEVNPGFGADRCGAGKCSGPGRAPDAQPFVYLTQQERDLGLVVLGTKGDDAIRVAPDGKVIVVTSTSGQSLKLGDGCKYPTTGERHIARCEIGNRALRFVLAWGDDGDDTLVFEGAFPRDITITADGGEGDDVLRGGDEEDIFFAGRTGRDLLEGRGGDDALLTESYAWDQDLPAEQYPGGADVLDGGDGYDQLVADYPCGGHTFIGGSDWDIAGFARAGSRPIKAQLGGDMAAESKTPFVGRAFNDLCLGEARWGVYATHIGGDLEILEGADGDDQLHGNDRPNIIWGRGGNDLIVGHGGDDLLRGLGGQDTIYGGPGKDILDGGAGHDFLFGRDGEADQFQCGDEGGTVEKHDGSDQIGGSCSIDG